MVYRLSPATTLCVRPDVIAEARPPTEEGLVVGPASSEPGVNVAGGATSIGADDPSVFNATVGCVDRAGVDAESEGAPPVCNRRFQSWPVDEVEESATFAG